MASEKPILFSGEMVRAILDGRKTQTRRVIKARRGGVITGPAADVQHAIEAYGGGARHISSRMEVVKCPYGGVGDRLYVRETTWISECGEYLTYNDHITDGPVIRIKDLRVYHGGDTSKDNGWPAHRFMVAGYSNKGNLVKKPRFAFSLDIGEYNTRKKIKPFTGNTAISDTEVLFKKKTPSIHMPKWAARIWLEITGLRVERVQDIDAVEAEAEGIRRPKGLCPDAHDEYILHRFEKLWDTINAKRGYGWDKNPLVWVVEFEVKHGEQR